MTPSATYRLQLHADFTFADAARLAPYLNTLGISHVYLSPILAARAGSVHGYDGIDPTRVNPALGGEAGLRAMVATLRSHDLGVIVDIVPNHMAVGGADNPWWLDVLENGPQSPFARYFDIDWAPLDPALRDKLLTPFLGVPYGEALRAGDIGLVFDTDLKRFAAAYYHHRFPIRPCDYPGILAHGGAACRRLAERFRAVGDRVGFARACEALASETRALAPALQAYIAPPVLHELLERQHFRLAHWQVAGDELNWRRFFDITELAALRVEDEVVFDAVHGVILRLYAEGLIDGLRVDHVDGLRDPAGYCRRLRARLDAAAPRRPSALPAGPAYLIVEKILAAGEALNVDWRCDGTTGYDFMNTVSAVQHDLAGEKPLTDLWVELDGGARHFETMEREARTELLVRDFAGQLAACARSLHRIARADPLTRDLTRQALGRGLAALLAAFPAYRTYATGEGLPHSDAPLLTRAMDAARPLSAPGEGAVLDFIVACLDGRHTADGRALAEVRAQFQQLSAPIAAKAVEDTAFYRYGRLLSRNDVGFQPGCFALSSRAFHDDAWQRAATYPAALLATATHDHKRGEDVRARLAAISEDPAGWSARIGGWMSMNAAFTDGAVDPEDEYMLYQTLVGAWPPDLAPDDAAGLRVFAQRVAGWQTKAVREAKRRSSWRAPDERYERACRALLDAITDPHRGAAFLDDLTDYVRALSVIGAANGLAQAFLRCVAPGVPDCYQGAEFWDLSLVDPDNRRAVDFRAREAALSAAVPWPALMQRWPDGHLKQLVIATALRVRRRMPACFSVGDYLPLEVSGARAQNIIAFARRRGASVVVAAACRLIGAALRSRAQPLPDAGWWQDTCVLLPERVGEGGFVDAFAGERAIGPATQVQAADLFHCLPVALWIRTSDAANH